MYISRGCWQKNFSGGLIKIEPVLTTKMEEFLKFRRFKKDCVKIRGRGALHPLPTPMFMGFELSMQVVTSKMLCIRFRF